MINSTSAIKRQTASLNAKNHVEQHLGSIGTVYQISELSANNPANKSGCPLCFTNKAILRNRRAHQSGAVLIVGLILLLLLTLIGVTSSQVTSLEEKMAGNNRNINIAFQAAESALRAGEAATATVVAANYYTGSTQPYDWENAKVTPYHGGALAKISSANAPKFIIEMIGATNIANGSGGSLEAGTASGATGTANWYRITAQGKGADPNAVVMVQSIYRR